MNTNSTKTYKQFIEDLSKLKHAVGDETHLQEIINSSSISADSKEILLWRYHRRFFIKQVGALLQKKLNLVQPLSDRQVSRRLDTACKSFYLSILNNL